ncbi:uncharacterized protein BJ171DRAFT_404479, partial [Polychytrium aggregatum]|uniref:uncharacterized protein n=1 Tax=Polychytrium aggregatum TaxID=110093 RepID=UPI0022FF0A3E
SSTQSHYLFGYGSLINPFSRSRTVQSDTSDSIPVLVSGYQRSWNYNCRSSYTAVGVKRTSLAEPPINGVLIPIADPSTDFPRLDEREKCYVRKTIDLSQIRVMDATDSIVPFDRFIQTDKVVIWVYEIPTADSLHAGCSQAAPTDCHRPSLDIPIPQSYVDCILSGCLSISLGFAKYFIESTGGWDGQAWLNDRDAHPALMKYRPHVEGGEVHADPQVLDSLLEQHLPTHIPQRV